MRTTQAGFTLIEMIVSLALFSVVVTVAVGALLMLVGANDELQGEQSIMTNLSFALDSMSREIRTGTEYYCVSRPNYNAGGSNGPFDAGNDLDAISVFPGGRDCPEGSDRTLRGVLFTEAGDSITSGVGEERILYFYDAAYSEFDGEAGMLFRRIGTEPAQPILSLDVAVMEADFFVSSAEPWDGGGDERQPTVTIQIEAIDRAELAAALDSDPGNDPKRYYVQTTVTQRVLDL
jgi:prepilin-type N-terminal cleavage/methylation domain-containing protein